MRQCAGRGSESQRRHPTSIQPLRGRLAVDRGHASAHLVSNEARLRNAMRNVSLSTSSTASTPMRLLIYPPMGRAWRSNISVKTRGSCTDLSMMSLSVLTPSIPGRAVWVHAIETTSSKAGGLGVRAAQFFGIEVENVQDSSMLPNTTPGFTG